MSTATKTEELVVKFVPAKETKNTIKFDEVPRPGEPLVVGNLYVQKYVVERLGSPEILTVTISA